MPLKNYLKIVLMILEQTKVGTKRNKRDFDVQ